MTPERLVAGSQFYHARADVYRRFAEAEDSPRKIEAFLSERVKGKVVLDAGCGTGKYIPSLSPLSYWYYGFDLSYDALRLAKRTCTHLQNVSLFNCDLSESSLAASTVDLAYSCWVLGTILDPDKRLRGLNEIRRMVKRGGEILLIENDIGGQFEALRGRYPDVARTEEYNAWLLKHGFSVISRFTTRFEFSSSGEAQHIFGAIWGEPAAAGIQDRTIEHRVVIFGCNG